MTFTAHDLANLKTAVDDYFYFRGDEDATLEGACLAVTTVMDRGLDDDGKAIVFKELEALRERNAKAEYRHAWSR